MNGRVVYDLTTLEGTMKGLAEYLNVDENTVEAYTESCDGEYSVDEFLEFINVTEQELLNCELSLVTLHVTTNNDKCNSIKEYGLLNLQESITLDTPLSRYLKQKNILIDIENKMIHYKGKSFDISEKFTKFNSFDDEKKQNLTMLIYKLYEDYQINSFFGSDNVLDYGGYCNARPEFLFNLAEFLRDSSIEDDWISERNNSTYIFKFKTAISNCTDYTFFDEQEFALKKHELEYLDAEEIEIKKRKWVIYQSLANIYDENYRREYTCFLKFDVRVPFSDIIKIYSPEDYLQEYDI
ncbi:hypothetical protein ACQ5SI_26270 [Peribacillus frigoritolerans]|uniref:hypothetical protein n=1 Tax=Peribacillus frigoritolerans TaxID=450367 RepID=UPI003D32CC84